MRDKASERVGLKRFARSDPYIPDTVFTPWKQLFPNAGAMSRWSILMAPMALLLGLMSVAVPVDAAGDALVEVTTDDRLLAIQNHERETLGLSKLDWDPALAEAAHQYAARLAATDSWQHSPPGSRQGQGENLWMGTRGAFDLDQMVGGWLAERSLFRPGTFPSVSTSGNWEDVGHYTQIIWHGDRRVGCAIGSSARYDYLVCRYARPGNVMGEAVLGRGQMAT